MVSDFGPRTDVLDKPDEVFEETDDSRGSPAGRDANPEFGQAKVYSKSLGDSLAANHRRAPLGSPNRVVVKKCGNHPSQQHLSLDVVEDAGKGVASSPQRQQSVPTTDDSAAVRRQSRDDADVNKVEASVLRKRFARLIDTLRAHKFSISTSVEDAPEQGPVQGTH